MAAGFDPKRACSETVCFDDATESQLEGARMLRASGTSHDIEDEHAVAPSLHLQQEVFTSFDVSQHLLHRHSAGSLDRNSIHLDDQVTSLQSRPFRRAPDLHGYHLHFGESRAEKAVGRHCDPEAQAGFSERGGRNEQAEQKERVDDRGEIFHVRPLGMHDWARIRNWCLRPVIGVSA